MQEGNPIIMVNDSDLGSHKKEHHPEVMTKQAIRAIVNKANVALNAWYSDVEFQGYLKEKQKEVELHGGWSKEKLQKSVACLPAEVYAYVVKTFGHEVFTDKTTFKKIMTSHPMLRACLLVSPNKL